MLKYNHLIRRAVFLAVFLTAIQPAFALLTIKDPVVKNLSGNTASGAILQLISGGSEGTPLPLAAPYYSGSLYSSQFSPTAANGISVQTIAITEPGLNIVLKAWSKTPGPGAYYGFFSGPSGGTKDTFRWDPPTVTMNYKADVPYVPSLVEFDETTATNAGSGAKKATLNVVAAAGAVTDGQREGSTYTWQMGEKDGTLTTVPGAAGSTLSLSSTQVTAGKTYTFKVNCSGPWGASDWAQKDYSISGAGVGGAASSYTYLFYAPTSANNVVPTTVVVTPTTTLVTAKDLAAVINAANKPNNIVGSICYGDPATGKLSTAIFDSTGTVTNGGDFKLTAGVPVQVYTTGAGSVTIQ